MKKLVIGIDMSKEKLDLRLHPEGKPVLEWEVKSSTPAIRSSLRDVLKRYGQEAAEVLICAEYTGQYGYPLGCACEELRIDLWMENATQIKHSSGLNRGKNDKLDARKTAAYAIRFQDKVRLFSLPEKHLATLKQLVGERDMYMCDNGKYQGQLTDQKWFMNPNDYQDKARRMDRVLKELEVAIGEIEVKIQELIDSDKVLKRQHELLLSVDGAGERTAVKMIVETSAFRDFDSARKFCCHAGVAPFRYDSGSSVRSRSKVSNRADKSIKALLHMAALSAAIRMKGELNDCYLR
ncbi:MAG: transposase, partial [Tannerella sp.]|nr:transposase [Tannerella sp.]